MSHEIKILGISGKKQSGKNTAANYIVGTFLKSLELVRETKITSDGELWISDLFGDINQSGIFDINSIDKTLVEFRKQYLDDIIKIYSYADILKKDVCMKILGLTYEQCFGTDEQKMSLTNLSWKDMPGVMVELKEEDGFKFINGRLGVYYLKKDEQVYVKPGLMTAREVMQFAGTEIFRKMYPNVWVDATLRQIKEDKPLLAVITDVRFINEVEGIQSINYQSNCPYNGKVLRLTRDIFKGQDQHESEIALDNIPIEQYDLVIDNHSMTIAEQNIELDKLLRSIEPEPWLPTIMQ